MSADSIKNDLETAATWLVQMSRQGNWTNERRDNCEALAQRLRALPSLAELERDAGRLDWLEQMPDNCIEMRRTGLGRPKWRCFGDPSNYGHDSPREAIDAAIDAARASEAKPKNDAFDTLPDDYETGDY